MQTVLTTHRPWLWRVADVIATRWRLHRDLAALRGLDAHTLADIGIDRSEFSSITAEASSRVLQTRLRIIAQGCHA